MGLFVEITGKSRFIKEVRVFIKTVAGFITDVKGFIKTVAVAVAAVDFGCFVTFLLIFAALYLQISGIMI